MREMTRLFEQSGVRCKDVLDVEIWKKAVEKYGLW